MKEYIVNYPDGAVRIHKLNHYETYPPEPNKVFYNRLSRLYDYYQIVEMNDEEMWIEEISEEEYQHNLGDCNHKNYVFFDKETWAGRLCEY